MLIHILYNNRKYDMVKDVMLDELITSGKITKFHRSDGWVNIGHDPIRRVVGRYSYNGPERRRTSKIKTKNKQEMKLHLNYIRKILVISFFLLVPIMFLSLDSVSAFDKSLRTEAAKDIDVEMKGTFTLILYGGSYFDDIETIAIFDYESDDYVFEPYAPEFDYGIHRGLSAEEALKKAHRFISSGHSSFYRAQLRRILDDKGKTTGYELRPLYMPLTYGLSDVLDVFYGLQDQRVRIIIRLDSSVMDPRFENGGNNDD
jgi:hypothetical protein